MTAEYNPRAIAKKQYDSYKDYIVSRLREIADLICKEDFTSVLTNYVFTSPAGDGYGMDNTVIDFSYTEDPVDIEQALNYLAYLNAYSNGDLDLDEQFSECCDYI